MYKVQKKNRDIFQKEKKTQSPQYLNNIPEEHVFWRTDYGNEKKFEVCARRWSCEREIERDKLISVTPSRHTAARSHLWLWKNLNFTKRIHTASSSPSSSSRLSDFECKSKDVQRSIDDTWVYLYLRSRLYT